jgi:CheY-like chemotaxis protein
VPIVDDSRDVLESLGFALSEHGAAVHFAASAREAIEMAFLSFDISEHLAVTS